jgi:hypothetical protein
MINILLTLLLLFSLTTQSRGAWLFDGVNDKVTVGPSSVIEYPDGNWTVAFQMRHTTGTTVAEAVFAFPYTGTIYFDFRLGDIDKNLIWEAADDDVTATSLGTGVNSIADTNNHVVVLTRVGTVLTLYLDGTQIQTNNVPGFTVCSVDEVTLGAYSDSSDPYNGSMAWAARWSRALSLPEIVGLSADISPDCYKNDLIWYVPMVRDYNEIAKGITITNDGSTVVAHPRTISCS